MSEENERRRAGTDSRPNRLVEIVLAGADFDEAILDDQPCAINGSQGRPMLAVRLLWEMAVLGLTPVEDLAHFATHGIVRFRCIDDPLDTYPGWVVLSVDGQPSAAFGHPPRGVFGHVRADISSAARVGFQCRQPIADAQVWHG